ncbi:hypothetical protein AB0C70_23035 [Streptomyces sp. NPDC048564]|uniref:hypothetical protein n=1 Tax=Streptomyces sp. NPDC048564 TaxID=3155760 RepID=UPI00344402E7
MTRRQQPERLSAFTPEQWTDDGDEPATREGVLTAHAAWRRARREWHQRHAGYGTPPSAWFESQELAEALAALTTGKGDAP